MSLGLAASQKERSASKQARTGIRERIKDQPSFGVMKCKKGGSDVASREAVK